MNKREFLKTGAIIGSAGALSTNIISAKDALGFSAIEGTDMTINAREEYTLPPLDYDYNALEPHIDEATMKLHHDKHHAGYVRGLNKATAKIKEAIANDDYSLVKHWQRELAFHGSGHFLHSIFWKVMGPDKSKPSVGLSKIIDSSFGGFENFKAYFKAASKSVEGSGWGILAYQAASDKLVVLQAEKHQNLSQWVSTPILCIDVWEHAYYLNYQNKRGDYIDGFMNIINWDAVSKRYDQARAQAK